MPQRDIRVGASSISSSLSFQSDYLSILHSYPLSLRPNQSHCDMWLFLIGIGSGFRERNHEWMRWIGCLFCFSTFSSQTSQTRPRRSEEWSGAVETVVQWRGKEGVEVGSIHIRFELSPHFTGLQGKQLLLTLMLDIPKNKKYVFCRHKRHGSHYICQIPVYQVVSQNMFFASLQRINHSLTKHVHTEW